MGLIVNVTVDDIIQTVRLPNAAPVYYTYKEYKNHVRNARLMKYTKLEEILASNITVIDGVVDD